MKLDRLRSLLVGLLFVFSPLPVRAADAKPTLNGVVSAEDGSPVVKATVFIYTAAPKRGVSSRCPFCYLDCTKHSQTDATGHFKIESLDPALVFQLLVVARDRESKLVSKVDPSAGEAKIMLNPLGPGALNPKMQIAGLIIGEDGKPIAGAVISAEGAQQGSSGHWGGVTRFVDPMAVTDDDGHFLLICRDQVDAIHATVEGRGFAKRWVELKPGRDHLVRVEEGVTVTGRVVRMGKPIQDVVIGLTTSDRKAGQMLRCDEIASDKEGRFLVPNVTPEREFVLYATMASLKGLGALPTKTLTTGKSGTTWDAGAMPVQPGFRLAGRVLLSDHKPIPEGIRLFLGRENAWDHSEAPLSEKGDFEFTDVPGGPVGLNVRIKGYKCSKRNPSLDWLNGGIVGTVDRDISNLTILLEPGQWRFNGEEEQDMSTERPEGGDRQPSTKPLRGAKL